MYLALVILSSKSVPFLFIFIFEIYGNSLEYPQKESYNGNADTVGLRSCYDEGKRVAEDLFYEFQQRYKLSVKMIRIFNFYGSRMDPRDSRVISNFLLTFCF